MREINGKTYAEHQPHDLNELLEIIAVLRGPQGCTWDAAQTVESMAPCLQDECTEVLEAVEHHDSENLCEELGDLLYNTLMLCHIAEEENRFTFAEVVQGISDKLIRRHPHVFGEEPRPETPEEALELWKKVKKIEKENRERKE